MSRYEITVDSVVGPLTEAALDGFAIRGPRRGGTCLVGDVIDQAAFHGLLNRIQDLGLEIIEIQRVGDD